MSAADLEQSGRYSARQIGVTMRAAGASESASLPTFQNADVRLHFEVRGAGRPVVFLHGATVNFHWNYAAFGWPEKFEAYGFKTIGLDLRGHGKSDKPHDTAAYGTAHLAADVIPLLDHLKLNRVDLVAYSIGTAISLHLLQKPQPDSIAPLWWPPATD